MATDEGSDADHDLATWKPDVPQGWYYLGQTPATNYDSAPTGLIVFPISPDVVADVKSWELVWDDAGSKNKNDYALWRGVPPTDEYVVIGGIFSNNKSHAPPTDNETSGIKAIRKDLLVAGEAKWVWNDGGSGSDRDGAVWTCGWLDSPLADHVYPQVIIPVSDYKSPPVDNVWALSRDKVVDLS
uniref:FDS protein n=1 Tax=Flammulina velutipes TaxID=38945 RepID=D2JY92_FLAVE|nr:FDS protein [Flammulina velutipes]